MKTNGALRLVPLMMFALCILPVRESFSSPQDAQRATLVADSSVWYALDFSSLRDAVVQLGKKGKATLLVTNRVYVDSDLVLPSSMSVSVLGAGSFDISAGSTLRFEGPFEAPLQPCFEGPGEVRFGRSSVEAVYPQWWGANGGGRDASATTAALRKAVNSGRQMTVKMVGTFLVNGTVELHQPVRLVGEGWRSVILVDSTLDTGTDVLSVHVARGSGDGFLFQDFSVIPQGGKPGRDVLHVDTSEPGAVLIHLNIVNCTFVARGGGYAVRVVNNPVNPDGSIPLGRIENCTLNGGLLLENAGDSITIEKCTIRSDTHVALEMSMVNDRHNASSNVTIAENNIKSRAGAILLTRPRNVVIRENNIEQPNDSPGVYAVILRDGNYEHYHSVCLIADNKIQCQDPASEANAVLVRNMQNVVIRENDLYPSVTRTGYTYGVRVEGSAGIRVQDNLIRNTRPELRAWGVSIDSASQGCTVTGNTFHSDTPGALKIEDRGQGTRR